LDHVGVRNGKKILHIPSAILLIVDDSQGIFDTIVYFYMHIVLFVLQCICFKCLGNHLRCCWCNVGAL